MLDHTVNSRTQFTATVNFHFREHGDNRQRCFGFGDELIRRVPMMMNGVDSLNTVEMRVLKPGKFCIGHSVDVECRVIAPEIFHPIVKPGVTFELWDAGYFATGVVTMRNESGWQGHGLTSH